MRMAVKWNFLPEDARSPYKARISENLQDNRWLTLDNVEEHVMELTWAREIMKSIKLSFVSRLGIADRRLLEWCNKGVTISPLRSHKKNDWMWRKKSKYYTKTQALFFLPFHAVVKDHRRLCRLGRSLQSRIVHIKSAFFHTTQEEKKTIRELVTLTHLGMKTWLKAAPHRDFHLIARQPLAAKQMKCLRQIQLRTPIDMTLTRHDRA